MDEETLSQLPVELRKRLTETLGTIRYYSLSDFAEREGDEDDYVLKAEDTAEPGSLTVRFSTFDIKDSYGDIIRASALDAHKGKALAMVWAHDKTQIIGKGTINTEGKKAIWDGQLFINKGVPEADRAYTVIKEMGKLQEYSWGFRILEAKPIKEKVDGQLVWTGGLEITKAHPVEVSPVLVGANPKTGTLRIKAELVDEGLTMTEEYQTALAAVKSFTSRVESLAEKRGEEGRPLNEVNVERLKSLRDELTVQLTSIDVLLAAPAEAGVSIGERFKFLDFGAKRLALLDTENGES